MRLIVLLCAALTSLTVAHNADNHTKSMASLELLSGRAFEIGWVSQVIALDDGLERSAQMVYGEVQRPAVRDAVWDVVETSRAQARELKNWLKLSANAAPDAAQMALATADLRDILNAITGRTVPNHDMNMSGDADRAFLRGMIVADRYTLALAQIAVAQSGGKADLQAVAKGFIDVSTQRIKRLTTMLETLR